MEMYAEMNVRATGRELATSGLNTGEIRSRGRQDKVKITSSCGMKSKAALAKNHAVVRHPIEFLLEGESTARWMGFKGSE